MPFTVLARARSRCSPIPSSAAAASRAMNADRTIATVLDDIEPDAVTRLAVDPVRRRSHR
jgi:hypothetical protein